LLDAFGAGLAGHLAVAPVLLQPVVQPVLAHGGQFHPERPIEMVDDLGVALHVAPFPAFLAMVPACTRNPRSSTGTAMFGFSRIDCTNSRTQPPQSADLPSAR